MLQPSKPWKIPSSPLAWVAASGEVILHELAKRG